MEVEGRCPIQSTPQLAWESGQTERTTQWFLRNLQEKYDTSHDCLTENLPSEPFLWVLFPGLYFSGMDREVGSSTLTSLLSWYVTASMGHKCQGAGIYQFSLCLCQCPADEFGVMLFFLDPLFKVRTYHRGTIDTIHGRILTPSTDRGDSKDNGDSVVQTRGLLELMVSEWRASCGDKDLFLLRERPVSSPHHLHSLLNVFFALSDIMMLRF